MHTQNNTVVINWSNDEVLELLSGARAKHPLVYSFNLPGADGELMGHLIQSERCQLAHSERENKPFSSSLGVSSAEC